MFSIKKISYKHSLFLPVYDLPYFKDFLCVCFQIWFQNRRRKDVVAKQNGETLPQLEKDNKMVPSSVMSGVISELIKYEGDPKGKKLKAKITTDHRAKPYSTPKSGKQNRGGHHYNKQVNLSCQQNNFNQHHNHSPSPINMAASTTASPQMCVDNDMSAMLEVLSPESIASVGQRLSEEFNTSSNSNSSGGGHRNHSVGRLSGMNDIPSNEQLDMIAPPNTVVPNTDIGIISNFHHRDSESPRLSPSNKLVQSPQGSDVSPSGSAQSPTGPPISASSTMTCSTQATSMQTQAFNPYYNKPSQFSNTEYTHYQRDMTPPGHGGMKQELHPFATMAYTSHTPMMPSFAGHTSDNTDIKPGQMNLDKVFPFPLVAEPSMMISSLPSYGNEGYASGAFKPPHPSNPPVYTHHRDPYQPLLISPFNNPYYGGHDTSAINGRNYTNL